MIVHNKDGNDHDIVHLNNEHVVRVTVPTHDDENYYDDDDDEEEEEENLKCWIRSQLPGA